MLLMAAPQAACGQSQSQPATEPTHAEVQVNDDLRIDISAAYLYGPIDGFLQTPTGGAPGTTSPDRPTFEEIGIDNASSFDVALAVQWKQHVFMAGGRFINLDGDATLGSTLISQGVTYPAGSDVSSSVQLNWYRFGYGYDFSIDLCKPEQRLDLTPAVQGVLLDFDYELNGPGGLNSNRSYSKAGVRIGGAIAWTIDDRWAIEGGGFWGLPIDNTAEISSLELVVRCRLWGDVHAGGSAFVGVGYDRIEYEDDQPVPNHIKAEIAPQLIAGLSITF